jgi:signal peptidase I
VFKIDTAGDLQWQKSYGGSDLDVLTSIEVIEGVGYLVGGYTESDNYDIEENYGAKDLWLLQLDKRGNVIWSQNYGGSEDDRCRDVKQIADNRFIAGGYTDSDDHDVTQYFGKGDGWLIKIDSTGQLLWEQNYGGSLMDRIKALQPIGDSSVVVGAETSSRDYHSPGSYGKNDFWVFKVMIPGQKRKNNSKSDLKKNDTLQDPFNKKRIQKVKYVVYKDRYPMMFLHRQDTVQWVATINVKEDEDSISAEKVVHINVSNDSIKVDLANITPLKEYTALIVKDEQGQEVYKGLNTTAVALRDHAIESGSYTCIVKLVGKTVAERKVNLK